MKRGNKISEKIKERRKWRRERRVSAPVVEVTYSGFLVASLGGADTAISAAIRMTVTRMTVSTS